MYAHIKKYKRAGHYKACSFKKYEKGHGLKNSKMVLKSLSRIFDKGSVYKEFMLEFTLVRHLLENT
jgi:cell fate (sporulation/competence/biofilm development) regulator YmcA (YheA/YmcA/DUF963 family)